MDTTICPECGALAEVLWRAVLDSTEGPTEHARIDCARRHWFLLPVASLPAVPMYSGSADAQFHPDGPPAIGGRLQPRIRR